MTSAPRILFVDHAGVLGGAELSLLDIAVAWRDDATVLLFEDGPFREALERDGVQVTVWRGGAAMRSVKKASRVPGVRALWALLRAAWRVRRSSRGCAIVYANSPKAMLAAAIGCVGTRRPVVWHLRDILGREHFGRASIRLLTRVANWRVARVIANSGATADAFAAAGGDTQRVRKVHNGIDAASFAAVDPDARRRVREELGIPTDAYVAGCFSRLHPWKGQHVLLDALAALPDVHGLVVGGALFSGDAEYEQRLRTRASYAPLAGRVHLLGVRTDIPALMSACDLVVHTSVLPEPFGRVLVEAMLARRPLIASDAGGVREVVQRDRTGLLVPPDDAAALASAIRAVRAQPATMRAMVDAAAADARDRFSREAMLDGVRRVLAELTRPSR